MKMILVLKTQLRSSDRAYFVYRFATELIRPEPELALGLTFYQWASLVFIPVFVVLWVRDRFLFKESFGYTDRGARADS